MSCCYESIKLPHLKKERIPPLPIRVAVSQFKRDPEKRNTYLPCQPANTYIGSYSLNTSSNPITAAVL
ncbi:hypothetical protein TMatcc_002028 [Talaromyces marneffei ATCC 18224]